MLLDLTGLTTLADAFVICSGGSERQLDAIADGIVGGLRDEKIRPIGREGTAVSHWVLLDFGDVVVHIFTPPEREYYSLEKHWAEARRSSGSSNRGTAAGYRMGRVPSGHVGRYGAPP